MAGAGGHAPQPFRTTTTYYTYLQDNGETVTRRPVSIVRTAPSSCAAVPHAPRGQQHPQNAAHTADTALHLCTQQAHLKSSHAANPLVPELPATHDDCKEQYQYIRQNMHMQEGLASGHELTCSHWGA